MHHYVAVDPGLCTGWAAFNGEGLLLEAGVSESVSISACSVPFRTDAAIVEKPQIYTAGKSKGNPNDLITLAIQVGRYVERFELAGVPDIQLVLPATWKGQVPKEIHHERMKAALSPTEIDRLLYAERRITAVSKRHNMYDAVALGQWAYKMRVFK